MPVMCETCNGRGVYFASMYPVACSHCNGTGKRTFYCQCCGEDLGWDRPSGVCSERCLREIQGFPVKETDCKR